MHHDSSSLKQYTMVRIDPEGGRGRLNAGALGFIPEGIWGVAVLQHSVG